MRIPAKGCWIIAGVLFTMAGSANANPVAGLNPAQRPDGAPEITGIERDGQWYQEALTGIQQPYPASLSFLEDQGNWHTPFNRPGMPGRYDLRGWYR